MTDELFLKNLGVIIIAAAVLSLAARKIKMPTLVAYLLAGVALGPLTGIIELTESIHVISEVGIVLLLFLVGLELSLNQIREVGKVAVVAGIGQVLFTIVGGYALCWILGFKPIESLFLATALTFSSTVVVVKLLEEKNEIDHLYGQISVGIFLVQDLIAIVFLTILSGLGRGQGETLQLSKVAPQLLGAFGGMAVLLGGVLLASRYLLPRPVGWAARSPETLIIWSLSWCFLVVLGAHLLHLSIEIGAFLAGLSLAQLPYNQDLRRRVHPLMNFFLAVFFVSLGIEMHFDAVQDQWATIIWLSLFILLGNPLIFMLLIALLGYTERTSFLTSVTVAQISEFSFIFIAMGVETGLIGGPIASITSSVGLCTIAVSAYMILYNHQLYNWISRTGILRLFRAPRGDDAHPLAPRKGHIIVIGMNSLGREIVKRLFEAGEKVVAIDSDPEKLKGLPSATVLGNVDYQSVLEDADFHHAKLLISALQIEETNDLLAYRCKRHHIPCCIHVGDLNAVDNLLEMDVGYFMIPKVDGIKLQNRELKRLGYIE